MFDWFKLKNNNIDPIVEEDTEKILPNNIKTEKNNQHILDKLTISKLQDFQDDEVIEYLKKHWNMPIDETIQVWGIVTSKYNEIQQKYYNYLINIKDNNGKELEYPVADLKNIETMQDEGVFISFNKEEEKKRYISCELELSKDTKKRAKNPILLKVKQGTNKTLDKIPYVDIIKNNNGDTMIERSIINQCIASNKEAILKSNRILFEEKDEIKKEINLLHGLYKKQEQDTLKSKALNDIFLLQVEEKKEEKKSLIDEVDEIKKQIEMEKEMQTKTVEEFRSYILSKAKSLLDLEFISQDQHDILTEKYTVDENTKDLYLDFKKDLHGDFPQAISHIQSYLFKKNIIYPRYILEDYFALLQTNDLIILAGDSGSGKTNLVKSFAEAVGGVSKIIPVKPNWTSSEDLLGYYNPLEKKYLSTPFLDALLEARRNPKIPYFICLDEMNLARVEYYFADFLSKLEERKDEVKIFLYSDTESGHALSEFNHVLDSIQSAKKKFKKDNLVKYMDILKDEEVNNELKRIFGFSDKDSLIKYHSDLRKMISGILDIPPSITFPKNVRIIGTVNIDETTHYLSPKVLDRAHIMKFESPLLYDRQIIEEERGSETDHDAKIKFSIEDFGVRKSYPEFKWDDDFCLEMADLTKNYFTDLGVDVGFRAIKQGLNYREILNAFQTREDIFKNNFILHKILPKFHFDGSSDAKGRKKIDILKDLKEEIRGIIGDKLQKNEARSAMKELEDIIRKSSENDDNVNYWA